MPFALLIIGLLLVVAGARGTAGDLATLLKSDFSGSNNFFYWFGSILLIGALGYYSPAEKVSRMFLALILIVMILANKGLFQKLTDALANIQAPPAAQEAAVGAQIPDAIGGGGAGAAGGGALATVDGIAGALGVNGAGNVVGSIGQTVQGAQSVFGQVSGGVGQIQGGNVIGGLGTIFKGINTPIPIPSFMAGAYK